MALLPILRYPDPRLHTVAAAVTEVDHRLDPPLMRVTCELLLLDEG